MRRCSRVVHGLAAAGVLVAGLATGCDGTATCDDFDQLTDQLAATSPDDQDYYDIRERLNEAQADCNR